LRWLRKSEFYLCWLLKPALKEADVKSAGRIINGTVKGDPHDIGKNLVAMMLECAGFGITIWTTMYWPKLR